MENEVKQVRCAIYTRKSTDENLNSEFNSLDAQREACENYIRVQADIINKSAWSPLLARAIL